MNIKIGGERYIVNKRNIKLFMKAVENYNTLEKILKLYRNFKDILNNYKDFEKWAELVVLSDDEKTMLVKVEDYKYTIENNEGEYELRKEIDIYEKDKIVYENIDVNIIIELIEYYI